MTSKSSGIELDPAIERKLLAGLVVAVLLVAGMAAAAARNNARQAESAAWVEHTHAFILESDAIVSALNAAEAAQRTFLLTGDAGTKQAATEKFGGVAEHLTVAQKLAFENPTQLQRLDRVAALLQRQIDWNKQAVQLRAENPAAAAGVFTNSDTRANLTDIEKEIRAAKAEENNLLLTREQTLQKHTRRTEQILYAGAAFNLALLGMAFYLVRRDLNLRRAAAAALGAANESLEAKVKERTTELASANEKLQVENIEQKWGQAALQRLVGHHELIWNSIREAILVISRNGKVISANAAAADLALREARQLPGKSISELLTREKDAHANGWDTHFLAQSVKEGRPMPPTTAFLKKPDGGVLPVKVTCHPTRDQENLTGAVITITA
jgi:PAS domain S-box-containing protein